MMKVEIITPRKIEFQGEADCVVLPALSGEIAVLPQHASLVSVLKAGKIRIKNKGKEDSFEAEGGIAQINENSVIILLKKFYSNISIQ